MHIGGSQDPPEIKEDTIMAQVTMDSKEYLEFVDKARQLEVLKSRMVDECEISVDLERSWSPVNVTFHPVFPQDTLDQIVELVTDAIVAVPEAVGKLVAENEHFLNLASGHINSHWDDTPERDEVDLLLNKKFKAAWEEAKQTEVVECEEEE